MGPAWKSSPQVLICAFHPQTGREPKGPVAAQYAQGQPTHEQQREDDGELVHRVAQNVLHHGSGDQGLVPAIWLPQQQRIGGRLCRQGQRGKCVHNQVHPQHLHGFERRVLWRGGSHPNVVLGTLQAHGSWEATELRAVSLEFYSSENATNSTFL